MSAFDYTESIITVRRKGDSSDPYIPISIDIMIKNGLVQLPEIPDKITKVQVTGNSESWFEISNKKPTGTEYKVSYLHGYVEFDPSNDGKTLNFEFMGTGNTFISAERVWVESDGTSVTKTLGDIIEAGKEAIENLEEVNDAIDRADQAADNANQAAADTQAVIDDANNAIDNINNTNTAIQNAEGLRVIAENERESNESIRQANEIIREQNEDARNDAEDDRESAEAVRVSQEQTRENNETIRQQQEQDRQDNTAIAISNAETATQNAQTVADNTRGVGSYNPSTTYVKNNIVSYNGSSYMALVDELVGVTPGSDSTKWQLMAQRGVDGLGSVVSVNGKSPDLDGNIELIPEDIGAEDVSKKGQPDGYASLDSTGNVPLSQLGNVEGMEMHGNEWHTEDFETVTGAQTKANTAENNAKVYTDEQIALVTETGIPKLVSYQFKQVATEDDQTVFEIPMDTFDDNTDTLMVYQNSVFLDKTRYVITNTVASTPVTRGYITLNDGVSNETEISMVVLKNVPIGSDGAINGAVIAVDSLPQDRVKDLVGDLTDINDNISDLAGEGRTTETVKGNADALAAHKAETAKVINVSKYGSFQEAIDYAVSIKTSKIKPILYIPYDTEIQAASTVVIPAGISVIMDGWMTYTGTADEPALVIGEKDIVNVSPRLKLNVRRQVNSDWTSEDNIGIQIINLYSATEIDIVQVYGFTIGVQFIGWGEGVAYNAIRLGALLNNKIGVDLTNKQSSIIGWCNENIFLNGRFSCFSGINEGKSRYGVRITSQDGTYINNNNNVFMKPSFELRDTLASPGEAVPILIEHGGQNKFTDCRNEANNVIFARVTNASYENEFNTGFGGIAVDDQSTQPSSLVTSRGNSFIENAKPVYNSGPVASRLGPYNGNVQHVAGLQIYSYYNANTYKEMNAGLSVAGEYLHINNTVGIGIRVNTKNIKKFVVRRDVNRALTQGRVAIRAYDSTGTLLTGTSPAYVKGTRTNGLTYWSNRFGGAYQTGSDSASDCPFTVHDDVDFIDVIISGCDLRSFSIFAWRTGVDSQQATAYLTYNEAVKDGNLGTASPTAGTWPTGKIVWNDDPVEQGTAGSMYMVLGWRCVTGGTPGTWKEMRVMTGN